MATIAVGFPWPLDVPKQPDARFLQVNSTTNYSTNIAALGLWALLSLLAKFTACCFTVSVRPTTCISLIHWAAFAVGCPINPKVSVYPIFQHLWCLRVCYWRVWAPPKISKSTGWQGHLLWAGNLTATAISDEATCLNPTNFESDCNLNH